MLTAPIPENDDERVKALLKFGLLDSPTEERFDRLTRMAQQTLKVPIALISLVDLNRQWFKSKVGINATQTDRCISFCGHAIVQKDIFVVENALADPRFFDNPLVTGDLGLRFYAGRPLFTNKGDCIGTLCVIDSKSRQFNEKDRQILDAIAKLVELEINVHSAKKNQVKKVPKYDMNTNFSKLMASFIGQRRIAASISLLVALGIMLFAFSWHQKNLQTIEIEKDSSLISSLANIRGKLETEINSRLHLTQGLAGLVRANKLINEEQFQQFASDLGKNLTSIRSIQLAPQGVVQFVWPLSSNVSAIGHNLLADPKRLFAAQQAINTRTLWIAGPLSLIQGGDALIARLPIFVGSAPGSPENFWGFASILIDMPAFIKEVGLDNPQLRETIAIRGKDAKGKLGDIFYGDPNTIQNSLAQAEVSLPGGSWEISIKNHTAIQNWPGQTLFWVLSVVMTLGFPWLIYLLLRLPQKFQGAVTIATDALKKSEIRFRDAIEALPDGFVIYDENDKLYTCNERYRQVYQTSSEVIEEGRSYEEIMRYGFIKGQYHNDSVDKQSIDDFVRQRAEFHLLGTSIGEEHLASGQWMRMVERPIHGGGVVGLRVDITELKHKEQELAQARDLAQAANIAKSNFLATVSHEVRTPMNVILGLLEILKSSKDIPKEQLKFIDTAHLSAQQLLHIINEILDISKIEAGKLDLEVEPFSLKNTIENVINLSSNRAADKNLRLLTKIENIENIHIKGDEGHLHQILLNIVTNAIKFTNQGQVLLEVSQAGSTSEQILIRFDVTDTGIGFTNEQAKKLFSPFVQLDNSASRCQEGTGLGLFICKKMLELMNSKISAKGIPNKGAIFSFTIPFAKVPASMIEDIKKANDTLSSQAGTEPLSILLAEDSPSNQMVLQAMLANTHYNIDIVANGKAAVQALTQQCYDLVLMDIFMPEMDGIQATKLIRENSKITYVPIIALTANAMKGDKEKFIDAGMDDYIPKPINKVALLQKLAMWGNKISQNSKSSRGKNSA